MRFILLLVKLTKSKGLNKRHIENLDKLKAILKILEIKTDN